MASAFGAAAADYERARPSYPPESIDILRRELGVGPGARVCDLAAGTGKLDVLDGTAEAIPLDDDSVDVVTVAQAFHWFKFEEALAEIRRVLRRGGGLAILFNQRDERVDWVKTWNEVIEWHSRRISYYQTTDWTALLEGGGFRDIGHETVEWNQPLTRDLLASRVRSVSYIADADPATQREFVDRVLALTEGFGDTFPLPYVTHVWFGKTA